MCSTHTQRGPEIIYIYTYVGFKILYFDIFGGMEALWIFLVTSEVKVLF